MNETELTVPQLRKLLDSDQITSEQLLAAFLQRVEKLDEHLNSIIELNPEALELARAWDRSGRRGQLLGGIPVLLKDNIATADQMVTSAGSAALADSRYPKDAGVVKALRSAGGILLGKANMSEWANYRSNNSTSGWSARGGQCRNPHDLKRSPCGSSSGSAAALAASLTPLALGTETVGSIACPSGICGVVGLKPTSGLLPEDGIIPIATSWDTAGPMARSVTDVAWLLEALTGGTTRYSDALTRGSLRGARVAVAESSLGFDARVDRLVEREVRTLEKLGAKIAPPVQLPPWSKFGPLVSKLMAHEFRQGVNAYLAGQAPQAKVRSLAQVIEFNRKHPELEAMENLGQHYLTLAQDSPPLSAEEHSSLVEELFHRLRENGMEPIFSDNNLDLIVGATNGPAWVIDFVNGDHYEGGTAAQAAVGGYPHITVPGGVVQGLPIGLSFIGRRFSEQSLLSRAFDYEQETRHFRKAEPGGIS